MYMQDVFINDAITRSIYDYLEYKDSENHLMFNSFLVVIIRKLVLIYDELDIIYPFKNKNEIDFDNNLMKFGYPKEELKKFKSYFALYYNEDKKGTVPNEYFIELEKLVINMFITKKVNFSVTDEEVKSFERLIYSPEASHEYIISYNYLHSNNENYLICYYRQMNEKYKKIIAEKAKELLPPEAYRVINKNYTDICILTPDEVDKINEQVYTALEVKKNAINFDYLFETKLYNFIHKDDKITSGNGFVDILLVMGVVCTLLLVIIILTMMFM